MENKADFTSLRFFNTHLSFALSLLQRFNEALNPIE